MQLVCAGVLCNTQISQKGARQRAICIRKPEAVVQLLCIVRNDAYMRCMVQMCSAAADALQHCLCSDPATKRTVPDN
jgi:hypothetical protein